LLFDGNKSTALYAFKTDLRLQNNLISSQSQRAAQIETRLKAMIQQYNNRMVDDDLTGEGPQRETSKEKNYK